MLFHQLKGQDSNSISVNDLETALVNQGETKIRKVDLLQLFHDIDIIGSDQITYLDFVAANMRVLGIFLIHLKFIVVLSWVSWRLKRTSRVFSISSIKMLMAMYPSKNSECF